MVYTYNPSFYSRRGRKRTPKEGVRMKHLRLPVTLFVLIALIVALTALPAFAGVIISH